MSGKGSVIAYRTPADSPPSMGECEAPAPWRPDHLEQPRRRPDVRKGVGVGVVEVSAVIYAKSKETGGLAVKLSASCVPAGFDVICTEHVVLFAKRNFHLGNQLGLFCCFAPTCIVGVPFFHNLQLVV